ncbi:SRPBCC family protein [Chitinophaga sp. 22321]|uniref:SRPBCC family protein n=1 Tax=Chitinophaga hostae TaxID=2831022 RepID=A0ABS5IXQ2_9BACT|nr:SRPBCC family protein [Chitinophaga hostae]MBS0027734.1 SRPBCC family protein [Chitinophaga hostae]
MSTAVKTSITVSAIVNAPVAKVWDAWGKPEHIVNWCSASADWHVPKAENDLRTGGTFSTRMEAKDGSFGFDFGGIYDEVKTNEIIAYTMGDGRKVHITFEGEGNATKIIETFDAEAENSVEMQQAGWQAILDNFKNYTEAL